MEYTDESLLRGICTHIKVLSMGGAGTGSFGEIPEGELWELAKGEAEKYFSGEKLQRGLYCARGMMALGCSKIAAAVCTGVYLSENSCDPSSCCEKEKKGGGTSSTQGGGYGCGIASWTGIEHKKKALRLIGREDAFPAIEQNTTFDEQIKMAYLELKGDSWCVQHIINTTSMEEASVAAMFNTHGRHRPTLEQYGLTYKAAYEEQLLQTVRLMKWSGRSTPSMHHKTGLLTRILIGHKLFSMI